MFPSFLPLNFETMQPVDYKARMNLHGLWFKIKWNGHRVLMVWDGEKIQFFSRQGYEITRFFPEFKDMASNFKRCLPFVIDGEMVAFEKDGITQNPHLVLSRKKRQAIKYVPFDLVYFRGKLITKLPLKTRRSHLEKLPFDPCWCQLSPVLKTHHEIDGLELAIEKGQYEGWIAKDPKSPYIFGRSSRWIRWKP